MAVARQWPYVMYFRFVDDVTFSHNGANRPESNRRRIWFIQFTRWRHHGRNLPYLTASRLSCDFEFWPMTYAIDLDRSRWSCMPKVISFEIYYPDTHKQTHWQTHSADRMTDCSTRPLEWSKQRQKQAYRQISIEKQRDRASLRFKIKLN